MLALWIVLLLWACIQLTRNLRTGNRIRVGLWLSATVGIVLAFVLFGTGRTTPSQSFFAHGVVAHLEIYADVDAIQAWVESLSPGDSPSDPQVAHQSRRLRPEDRPSILRWLGGEVDLEPDAEGQPSVRLTWREGKAGTWGLVIGRKVMGTPSSEPGMYAEKRTELRPGVYFWYVEA